MKAIEYTNLAGTKRKDTRPIANMLLTRVHDNPFRPACKTSLLLDDLENILQSSGHDFPPPSIYEDSSRPHKRCGLARSDESRSLSECSPGQTRNMTLHLACGTLNFNRYSTATVERVSRRAFSALSSTLSAHHVRTVRLCHTTKLLHSVIFKSLKLAGSIKATCV